MIFYVSGGSPLWWLFLLLYIKNMSLYSKKPEMDNYRGKSCGIIPVSPFKNRHSYCKILSNKKEEQM